MVKNILTFEELSARTQQIFKNADEYEAYRNLKFDLTHGMDLYDEDGKVISKTEANKKLLEYSWKILGINERSTKRQRRRALDAHGREWFNIIEEDIDFKVETGFRESEFFNRFVEERNLSRYDSQEFWSEEDIILSVHRISGDHHDFSLQRLGTGESYTVPTSVYGIAVGADIDLYLNGKLDWNKFTDACAKAFITKIQNSMYSEVMNAGKKLPTNPQFHKTLPISAATKDEFDTLLEDVSIANDNAPVVIFGTKTALKKLTAFADIDWVTDDQKQDVATMGRLGSYEGTALFEIPQRFAPNDVTKKLVDPKKLLIIAQVEDKFVKFVDSGETEILEITEKGDRMDDTMKYEVQRAFGIGTQISRYFGDWDITE